MNNKVIRNKNRNYKAEKYQPEHVRLAAEPIMCNPKSEVINMTKSNRGRRGVASFITSPPPRGKVTVREPMMQPVFPEQIDENQYVKIPTGPPMPGAPTWFSGTGNPAGQEYDANEEVFSANYVSEKEYRQPVALPEQQPQLGMAMPEDVSPNEYCIVLHGNIICKCDTAEQIEDIIENLLYGSEQTVNTDDLIVFKRMDIRIGVSVR